MCQYHPPAAISSKSKLVKRVPKKMFIVYLNNLPCEQEFNRSVYPALSKFMYVSHLFPVICEIRSLILHNLIRVMNLPACKASNGNNHILV